MAKTRRVAPNIRITQMYAVDLKKVLARSTINATPIAEPTSIA